MIGGQAIGFFTAGGTRLNGVTFLKHGFAVYDIAGFVSMLLGILLVGYFLAELLVVLNRRYGMAVSFSYRNAVQPSKVPALAWECLGD